MGMGILWEWVYFLCNYLLIRYSYYKVFEFYVYFFFLYKIFKFNGNGRKLEIIFSLKFEMRLKCIIYVIKVFNC